MSDIVPIEQKMVEFNGSEILGIKANDGDIYIGVRWVCQGIGLEEDRIKYERKKLQEDLVLKQGGQNFTLPTNGGIQEVLCLRLKFLPLWLAKISITPTMIDKNPALTQRLIEYQLKAADVLASAFTNQLTEVDQYLNMGEEDRAIAYFTIKKERREIEEKARKLAEENRVKEEQLKLQAPKAALADMVVVAKNVQSMGVVARTVGMGRNKLFDFLRDKKVIMPGTRIPYQKFIDCGYFIVRQSPRQHGEEIVNDHVTKVTAKGLEFIAKLIRGNEVA